MQKLLIGLASIFILVSCATFDSKTEQDTTVSGLKNDYQAELQTASNKIKATKEFADCMQPAVSMCVNSIGMQLAQKAKSTEFCNELSGKDQQDGCQFAVTMSIANEKNDPSLCATLSGTYISQCTEAMYRSQAINTKDISLCDKLEESPANVTSISGSVAPVKGGKKEQCIFSVIISNSTTTEQDCKKIRDSSLQNTCITSLKNRIHALKTSITQ